MDDDDVVVVVVVVVPVVVSVVGGGDVSVVFTRYSTDFNGDPAHPMFLWLDNTRNLNTITQKCNSEKFFHMSGTVRDQ